MFSGGMEMEHWLKMGLLFELLQFLTFLWSPQLHLAGKPAIDCLTHSVFLLFTQANFNGTRCEKG